jgi:hypothetical protein
MERRQRARDKDSNTVDPNNEHTMFPTLNSDEDKDDLDAPRMAQWEDEDLEDDELAFNESEQTQLVGGILFLKLIY